MTDFLARLHTALARRYAIERELGRGGMATLYLARDLKHERPIRAFEGVICFRSAKRCPQ